MQHLRSASEEIVASFYKKELKIQNRKFLGLKKY